MSCASCGRANPDGARFCGGCGASLAPRCAACGAECADDARFCTACGAPIANRAPEIASARKVVTIVFADLIGSVSLHERLDAESARRFMDRYHRTMSAAVQVHGGRVIQLLGDGVLAAFGVPRVAEDDAIRAVRAGFGMQRAFREMLREQSDAMQGVGLRIAVNTGEIVVGDDASSVMGDPTNVAARLQHEARDGDVIVGESTQRLVADLVTLAPLGAFALRGRAEAVRAYRVVSLDRPANARATAFVGRDDELRRLLAVYDAAVAAPTARLAVLLGSPGLGKSRLVAELAQRTGERATVLSARCDADGGATFAPIADALRSLLRIDEGAGGGALRAAIDAVVPGDDVERGRIANGIAALFSGAPASPEEIFFAVRRLLAALAAVRPVVLAIDDLHWAEPLLLDLVEHLVQWSAGVPLFLLVAARPELREACSAMVSPGPLVHEVVALGGLDAAASMQLAAGVVGAAELPAALVGRVLATSEGNPLFLAELVRMLVQDGILRREGERWVTTVEVSKLDMPPTIQVLLGARIERLRPEERLVLERAAVIGRQFSRSAVGELLQRGSGDLDACLEALRRSELIEPDTGWFLGEPALRFHHVLIRDAAYRRVLKETRAELHERLAGWIESRVGEATEHEELLGFHCEQAHHNRLDLGALDAHGRALGERAARHLGAAGRRALARDDVALAASFLGRAIACLDPQDPARADLALDWCEALLSAGEVSAATQAVTELARFAATSDRLRAWHACFEAQRAVLTDPTALRASADAMESAAATLTAAGDAAGEAKAHAVHALVLAQLGKIGACEAALDRALAAARRARDRRRANAVLAGAPVAALWGPSPVTRASGRCLDVVRVLRITQGAPAVEAVALRCQAVLETLRGRADAARRMIAASRAMVEELGIGQRVLEADVFAGLIELLDRDASAAEGCLRAAWDGLRQQGLGIDAAQAGALLARALLALGRRDEAEALSVEAESLAGDSFKAAIAWRCVRAEALAARGEHESAVALARAAVEIAAATDDLLDHADARSALAVALRAAGRTSEADAEEQRAIELWEAKGATLLVERARAGRPDPADARVASDSIESAPARRRVRENAASKAGARLQAAALAGDMDAIEACCADDCHVVHHPTGARIDREGGLRRWRMLLAAEGLRFDIERLATLGDSLSLVRDVTSFERLVQDEQSFGASRSSYVSILESNARGQCARVEVFADDRLGDAVARLYERYAELQPEGRARDVASWVARGVAVVLLRDTSFVLADVAAPDVTFADRRTLGWGASRGPDALRAGRRAVEELVADRSARIDDVLAAQSGALLVRSIHTGTDRNSGGRFERPMLQIAAFDRDGRIAVFEWFDLDREAEALARFEEVVAGPAPPSLRRVRPNAATANAARMDAAVAARDLDAFLALLADGATSVHHQTRTSYQERDSVVAYQMMLSNQSLRFAHEPLATLGDSLALCRSVLSIESGYYPDGTEVGASDMGSLALLEVDERGLRTRTEFFAIDRLADAVARLYERHAELLPDDVERTRAASRARTIAAHLGPFDPQLKPGALAPGVVLVDRRRVGFGTKSGPEAFLRGLQTVSETGSDIEVRVDEVLAASPNALLVCWTTAGIDRRHGGRFEWRFLRLFAFDRDGLLDRYELFEPDATDAALARFDVLTDAPTDSTFANAARRRHLELERAWEERRFDEVLASYTPDCVMEDRRALFGMTIRGEGFFANLRLLLDLPESRWQSKLLATRGERLTLTRSVFRGGRPDGGLIEAEHLVVQERDAAGLSTAIVVFDVDDLDAAHAELDARFRAGEGAPFHDLLDHVRAFDAAAGEPDPDALERLLPSDFEVLSHRRFADIGRRFGRGEYVASMAAIRDMGGRGRLRTNHLRIANRVAIADTSWVGAREGDAFEIASVALFAHDGRVVRSMEMFDAEQAAEAIARYEQLSIEREPTERVDTTATRSEAAFQQAWGARDWTRLAAQLDPAFRSIDRRPLMQLEVDRDTMLRGIRPFFDAGATRSGTAIATRGDRLVLSRVTLRIVDDRAPSEVELLQITETDAAGMRVRGIAFAPDALDAAYAELDALHHAGEAASHANVAAGMREFARAFAARDWDALAARCAEDVEVHDRRKLGWEPLHGAAAYVSALRGLVELAPDTSLRLDHVEIRDRGYLVLTVWTGTREGGAFEEPSWMVAELDAAGRIRRFDQYDLDRLDAARARFEVLRTEAAIESPNRRVHPEIHAFVARMTDAFARRDVEALRAMYAENAEVIDRTTGTTYDAPSVLATLAALMRAEHPVWRQEPLATLGDSLVVARLTTSARSYRGRHFDVGGYERREIVIGEAAGDGRVQRNEIFAADRLGDAIARVYERFAERSSPGADRIRAEALARWVTEQVPSADPDAYQAKLAPDVEFVDHRSGAMMAARGRDRAQRGLRAIVELSERFEVVIDDVLALAPHALLYHAINRGTLRDGGGDYERPHFVIVAVGEDGLVERGEWFGDDQADAALARFDALRGDPLRIPPNAATRAGDRWHAAAAADDHAFIEWFYAPGLVFEDRRRGLRVMGGREMALANESVIATQKPHWSRTVLATSGERLALWRSLVTGTSEEERFEIEFLQVVEVDGDGRLVANVVFDADDRRGAAQEMLERYARGEGAATMPVAQVAFLRAMQAHDLTEMRAALDDDFSFVDHRRTGLGHVGNADDYVASVAALLEQSEDFATDVLYHLAVAPHGSLSVGRMFGTLRDGGPFESVFVRLNRYEDGRNFGTEIFEIDDLERAKRRFAELGEAYGARRLDDVPSNAASRIWRRIGPAFAARDWSALRALAAPDFRFDDRRRRALVSGDVETWIRNVEAVSEWGVRWRQRIPIAALGERVALDVLDYAGDGVDGRFLRLVELDENGALRAVVHFDPEDRPAAVIEAYRRFAAGEGGDTPAQHAMSEIGTALDARDWEALRASLAETTVIRDHRAIVGTAIGDLDRDEWIGMLRVSEELAPEYATEAFRFLAWNRRGRVWVARTVGRTRDGGPFEYLFVGLFQTDGTRLTHLELFDVGDLERALARFEELSADGDATCPA